MTNRAEVLALAALLVAVQPSAARARAVAYQIDEAHTGYTPATLRPPLTRSWAVDLGGSVSYPLIAQGKVFVTVSDLSAYGTMLYALDAGSGATVWGPVELGGTYFWSNAAYEHGRVFAVNYDGLLRAFDAQTGVTLWSVQLPNQYAFSSPPTAGGGTVYVGGSGIGGTLYAVDEGNGSVRWTADVENGDNSSPALVGSTVYVSYACQQDYAFDRHSGALVWHYDTGCEGGGGKTPVVHDGFLYDRDSGYPDSASAVLSAQSGSFLHPFAAGPAPAFAAHTGFFLTSVAGSPGVLEARSLPFGDALWTFAGDGGLSSAPIVTGRYVYVGSSSGMLYAVDRQSGQPVWSDDVGASILPPDEQNVSQPLTGLAASSGLLVVPASNLLVAYR
jgi:outer membrane protein assembly factor BamB